jgi:hypothetical protein
MGSPARVKSSISPEELTRLKEGPALYADLAREYKRHGL